MSALTQHPLSACFPAMSAQELSDLTDDIAANGLRHPVVTYQGQVLDGWHRYQACEHADVKPRLVEFDGDDPIAFVVSQNAHRRHLTAGQRTAAVLAATEWKPVGNRPVESNPAPGAGRSEAEIAKAAGSSVRTVQQVKAAVRAGAGGLVRDGKVSAKQGAAIASLPAKERAEAIADPEAWQDALARKSPPKADARARDEAELDDAHERMADLAADYEAVLRIVEADDKLGEARLIIKEQRAKYEQLEKLYDAQRTQLREMTAAAKRWQRKAEAKGAA